MKDYRIPNQLIGLGYITGLCINLNRFGLQGIPIFAFNAGVPVVTLALLFMLGGLGAGDIKLISVMSSMVGAIAAMKVFVISVIVAGIIATFLCIKEKRIVGNQKLHYSYYISAAFFLQRLWEDLLI